MLRPFDVLPRFGHDRRGMIAIWFALMLVPTFLLVGVGIDFGRGLFIHSQLQSAVDAAALAGATVYTSTTNASAASTTATTYMNNAITRLTGGATNVNFSVSPGTATTSGATTAYSVTVTATATSANAVTSAITSALALGVKATAKNYVYTATLSLSSFNSSAWDANAIYYYIVPTDGSAPANSSLVKMYSNTSSSSANSKAINVTLTGSQKLGFALVNVTGGIQGYGSNGYGGTQGSTHIFYSHLSPPSAKAYSSVTKNCNLQVTTSLSAVQSSSCFSSLPSYAALNCATAAGKKLYYAWNDMGGGSDDLDYNDAVFTVACAANDASATATGVVLTN